MLGSGGHGEGEAGEGTKNFYENLILQWRRWIEIERERDTDRQFDR